MLFVENCLILSFVFYILYYVVFKRIGELFLGFFKVIWVYLYVEEDVEVVFKEVGWVVKRKEMMGMKFYFFRLFECVFVFKV